MLTRFDDYPVHQTVEPVARPASSDRNVYDRYWFNGFADDGEFYFGVGMGLYPNRGILDSGFSILRDGRQHSFHASRRAPGDPSETVVGPMRIEVTEPMRSLRVVIEPNETGIECDLEFLARTGCLEEGRQTLHRYSRVFYDVTRFAQYGRWRGEVRYNGETLAVDPARVFGTKDRSWGVRPVGEPETGGAPSDEMPQFFFLWSPIQWKDRCTHFGIFEDERGVAWHTDGAVLPVYATPEAIPGVMDPGTQLMRTVGHRVRWRKGTRRVESAEIDLVSFAGETMTIALEPLLDFQMKGIGYTHPEWGHGHWKGELAVGGEQWTALDLDPMAFENLHVQQVVRARCGGEEGVGVLEQLVIGPHATYGFEDFLDGAK